MSIIDRPNASKPADANNATWLATIRQFGRSDFSTFLAARVDRCPGSGTAKFKIGGTALSVPTILYSANFEFCGA